MYLVVYLEVRFRQVRTRYTSSALLDNGDVPPRSDASAGDWRSLSEVLCTVVSKPE